MNLIQRMRARYQAAQERRARAAYLANPQLRSDYRLFDTDRMNRWGNNCHPWPENQPFAGVDGRRMVIWHRPRPRDGDAAIIQNVPHIVWNVDLCRDPDDMAFFTAHVHPGPLPDSTRVPSWTDGLV